MSSSAVTVVGHIVDEPRLVPTNGSKSALHFRLAVNQRIRGRGNFFDDEVVWPCNMCTPSTEVASQGVVQGARIMVLGTVRQRAGAGHAFVLDVVELGLCIKAVETSEAR